MTLLVGQGALHARDEVLELAEQLAAPMVVTLKAKQVLDDDNPYEVGQSGLIGNPATALAFDGCDLLLMVGTDFPYKAFLPEGKSVVQIDLRGAHIGRRTPVDHAVVGDARLALAALLPLLERQADATTSTTPGAAYDAWRDGQPHFADPDYDRKPRRPAAPQGGQP